MSLEDDVEACIEIKSADKGVSLIQLKTKLESLGKILEQN